tara:strand:- start:141 stop:689 length:549 start_codon:yes stop_codon:yes gene_type:complete
MQELNKYKTPKGFRGKPKIIVQIWWLAETFLVNMSPQFMFGWRRFLYRLFGAKIGKKVKIRPSVKTTYPWKVEIGDYSWIGDEVRLYSLGKITIGKNTVISQKSYLCTASHDYLDNRFSIHSKKIIVGDSCWLSTDVFVSPGVVIGNESIIGARSSVFRDIESNSINYGSPSKKIRPRVVQE